ncbi:MAG: hypothetical protein JST90_05900 [Bacteroidetes bacterium]|nr:hypothetical protein [Bacteroidota bacterium]
MNDRRKKRLSLVAITLLLILTAGLCEMALRYLGFYKTYTEKMDGEYVSYYGRHMPTWFWGRHAYDSILDNKPEYTYHSKANNYGFADKDFDTSDDHHILKALVLGDSFVQGMGAPPDSSWPARLESLLNVDTAGLHYRIYNAGTAGSDPFFEYIWLKEKLIKLHPDLVIMSINYSDVNDCITRGGLERFHTDGSTQFASGPWFEPLYRHVHLVRLFLHFVLRYDFSLLSPAQHERRSQAALLQLSDCADSAAALCSAHGMRFVVVLHPYLDPYDRYLKKQDLLPGIVPLLERRHIMSIDLFDDFRAVVSTRNYSDYSWPRDMHYTSRGYDLFARLLLQRIRKQYPLLLTKTQSAG